MAECLSNTPEVATADEDYWRPVVGQEGYRVSRRGEVESCWVPTGIGQGWEPSGPWRRIEGQVIPSHGYRHIWFRGDYRWPLHRVVLEAFVGPRPAGMLCRHLDGNKLNNDLSNLAWGTPLENSRDAVTHGTLMHGNAHFNAKLTESDIPEIRRLAAEGETKTAIAARFGVSRRTVIDVLRGSRWKHVA